MVTQGRKHHSFCPNCNRVIYSINTHGPITPITHNRTFCVCEGEQTGEIKQRVVIYGLEDILGKEGAKKERERQKKEQNASRARK